MYTLFSDLFTKWCGSPEYNLAILGLEQTGKTQLIKALKDDTSPYMVGLKQDYKPTIGLNSNFIYYRQAKQLSRKNMNYLVWDLGGKQSFRKVWQNYYPFCHGLVYLFDHRVDQGMECLNSILDHHEMSRVPLLIFARNSELYSKIKSLIEDKKESESMAGRKYLIQLLPHSRQRLYQHLAELYGLIRRLDLQVRK